MPRHCSMWFFFLLLVLSCFCFSTFADRPGWQHEQADLRLSGNMTIREIHYPENKRPAMRDESTRPVRNLTRKLIRGAKESAAPLERYQTETISIYAIDSPPIDGFVPWIAILPTDARLGDLELAAVPEGTIIGNFLTADPNSDYVIGLFDTGASAHLMGYNNAVSSGLYGNSLVTSSIVPIIGATGTIDALASQPIGVFVDGLSALEPENPGGSNMVLRNRAGMMGESNISIVVGGQPDPGKPDLPTAIGSPLSVYFATSVMNDRQVRVKSHGQWYVGPDIKFHDPFDPAIPSYPNTLTMQLRPMGAYDVEYFPCIEPIFDCPDGDGSPMTPSVIGLTLQSLFFVPSVDLYEGAKNAIDKNNFMFDTGAQVTVISSIIAARLALNPANADFTVDIQDATGDITIAPGFYIDSLEIPVLGPWLSYTNVPVVMLDIQSPEGGTLDGIIGMNLFNEYNFVLYGDFISPQLKFEPIQRRLAADVVPAEGDGQVDMADLLTCVQAWLAGESDSNWNPDCDMAPPFMPDGRVDIQDFAVMAGQWLKGTP